MLYASENAAAVTAACANKANIGERNRMAKVLFEAEEQEIQDHYMEAAKKRHEAELAIHNAALSGLPSTDPEERSKARDRLAEVVTPLLNLISEYTGFTCVTLIGGMAQGESWLCKSVNIGKTNDIVPQRFDEWDAPGFRKNFCGQFVRFVKECTKDAETNGTDAPASSSADQRPAPDISGGVDNLSNTPTSHPIAVPTNNPPVSQPSGPSTDSDEDSLPGVGNEDEHEAAFSAPPSRSPSPASSDEEECPQGVRAVLKSKVYALTGAERRAEIRRLRDMEEIELDRENNVVEREQMFADLRLDTMFKKPAKTKRPSKSRPVLSGSSQNNEDAATRGEDSISQRTRSFASGAQPSSDTPASPTSAASAGSTSTASTSAPCTNGAPAWLEKQYSILAAEDLPTAHRQLWLSTLKAWWDLERARGFEETKPGLPTTHRPADITLWIQNARKYRIVSKNKDAYPSQWWKWWIAINPSWRLVEGGKPLSGGTGDWSSLFKSGRNGFLTILASLVGLRNAADETEWLTALVDVNWVLGEVLNAQRTTGIKRARAGDDEDENNAPDDAESQTKRRKRKNA
ncbi:hypothetical protein EIP86_000134 [Pleurotus ostreatoroseus]|nr:hypothetical protein EIP86_000134 [Pleurotus ostreatoroseus]